MTFDRSIVSFIEAALDANPYCRACGAANTVRSDEERVLIECSAAAEPRSLVERVIAILLPHERLVVLP
jgi:hypothetical protein